MLLLYALNVAGAAAVCKYQCDAVATCHSLCVSFAVAAAAAAALCVNTSIWHLTSIPLVRSVIVAAQNLTYVGDYYRQVGLVVKECGR